jgi:hypothetical protein
MLCCNHFQKFAENLGNSRRVENFPANAEIHEIHGFREILLALKIWPLYMFWKVTYN